MLPPFSIPARVAGVLSWIFWVQLYVPVTFGQGQIPTVPDGHNFYNGMPTVTPAQLPFRLQRTAPSPPNSASHGGPKTIVIPQSNMVQTIRPPSANSTSMSQIPQHAAQALRQPVKQSAPQPAPLNYANQPMRQPVRAHNFVQPQQRRSPGRLATTQLTAQDFMAPMGQPLDQKEIERQVLTSRPAPPQTLAVPIQGVTGSGRPTLPPVDNLQIARAAQNPQLVSIFAQSVDLRIVLGHLAQESQVNIVVAESIDGTVTTSLKDVPLWEALDAILRINGLVWTRKENIIYVTKPGSGSADAPASGTVPGQVLQVFDLNYTSAVEVLNVVNGLVSRSGKAFSHAVDVASTRQTRERIIVEDFPDRIDAIAQYIASVDNPPRQVLIEAHVMQVTLNDNKRHGVNLLGLARVVGAEVTVQAQGFANAAASPGFMMGLTGSDLNGMIELLQSESDVRTLAAPKVLVVNGQEARIQIGSKFGYFVTTTTQTSTLQSVDFLDIGVVLQVQPTITHDGQVLLTVEPKVSGGRINPDTGLPEEETTEANTTVLLPNGRGMIIGGLIKEDDDHSSSWAPWIGEQPFIGKLFSRSNDNVQRVEVIIALTPHIVPYAPDLDMREHEDYLLSTPSSLLNDRYITAGQQAYPYGQVPGAVGQQHPVLMPNRYSSSPASPSVRNASAVGAPNRSPQYRR